MLTLLIYSIYLFNTLRFYIIIYALLIQTSFLTTLSVNIIFFFFFQAEDGIRDLIVTGVQTCALPISFHREQTIGGGKNSRQLQTDQIDAGDAHRDVAAQHHAFVEEAVEQVEHRGLDRKSVV